VPIVAALVPAAIGAYEAISGGIRNAQARKAAQNMQQTPYAPDSGIQQFYQEALNRYNTSPYNSLLYGMQQQNVNRSQNTALMGLQNRRDAIGGISSVVQSGNDSLLKAAGVAQNQRNQAFNVLGGAARSNAQQNQLAYNINTAQPFQRQFQLALARASGGAQVEQAGIGNIAGGLGAAANISQSQQMNGLTFWGQPHYGRGGSSGTGSPLSIPTYYNGNSNNSGYSPFTQDGY